MLNNTNIKVDITPIIEQVESLNFDKRLALNYTDNKLLNGPFKIKTEFEGTPLGNVLTLLGDIGEARLLKLDCAESYTAHSDPDDRLHLVITTNPNSYLIDLDTHTMYHLPVDGQVWEMDTGVMHVAANFGARPRIHLNIRKILPSFKRPGYKLSINGGDYDWKQESYIILMSFFNKAIKQNIITGFEKVNEREVLINCDINDINPYLLQLQEKGFEVTVITI
jgi:hypothetical protein